MLPHFRERESTGLRLGPSSGSMNCVLFQCRYSGGKADKPQQGKVIPGAAGKKALSSSYAVASKATAGKTPPGKTAGEALIEKTNVTTGGNQPAASTSLKVFTSLPLSCNIL